MTYLEVCRRAVSVLRSMLRSSITRAEHPIFDGPDAHYRSWLTMRLLTLRILSEGYDPRYRADGPDSRRSPLRIAFDARTEELWG